MNRRQLEHLLVVASRIAERHDIVVIGSQAILGSYEEADLPVEVTMSREADLAFWDDPDEVLSDRVDGAIGELSAFDRDHGYYAQGVSVTTAKLPTGWEQRLVRYSLSDGAVTGWCLEPHDLALSKLAAHRAKDKAFVGALIDAGFIETAILEQRVWELPMNPAEIRAVRREYEGWL